ncbi:MAG TPA: hypothetical protein VGD98_03580 [Ktedonobacteraceae bacterium]
MITTFTQAIYPLLFVYTFDPLCKQAQPLHSMRHAAYMQDESDAAR